MTKLIEEQIAKYHAHKGVKDARKWQLDQAEQRCVQNLTTGVSPGTKEQMRAHLNTRKWADSAYTTFMLRSPRWLVGFCGADANTPDKQKKRVTVSPESQELHMASYLVAFEKIQNL
jgi:hypothetical protein